MKKAELVVVPAPGAGHLGSAVELAKILIDRDDRLSITVLILPSPFHSDTVLPRGSHSSRLRFVELPKVEDNPNDASIKTFFHSIETQKRHVKDIVSKLIPQSESTSESPQLAGFVLDMFCTPMIDVANDFHVPSYIFFTSGAAALGLALYVQNLYEQHKGDPFNNSETEFAVPTLAAPLPFRFLPGNVLREDPFTPFFRNTRFGEAEGIVVNTFAELESFALSSLHDGETPPVYPVGPILNLKDDEPSDGSNKNKDITDWLDDQPHSCVIFLCFGSMGCFDEDQIKEIARGLEHSGHRFLWSLRKPPPKGTFDFPREYSNAQDVLPEGFLNRTVGIGKVIGWAPQVAILAHPAIGGFVSHCGWNSVLESLWFGVPLAAWPMYAEQQFNAFLLVKELGLATEIKMDYRRDVIFNSEKQDLVGAEEIERGIRGVMEHDCELRKKIKKMSAWSREALMDGGSSHKSLGRLIQDVINNMS